MLAASRSGRMEPAVDGRDENDIGLVPGAETVVGRRRGVSVCCLLPGVGWVGGEEGGDMPIVGDLDWPTRPY